MTQAEKEGERPIRKYEKLSTMKIRKLQNLE